jgi:hypothetical protein
LPALFLLESVARSAPAFFPVVADQRLTPSVLTSNLFSPSCFPCEFDYLEGDLTGDPD